MIKKAAVYPNSLEAIFLDSINVFKGISQVDLWEILQDSHDDPEFLYPIKYNGRLWDEHDCDEIFRAFYNHRDCFNIDGAVYVSGDDWVFPNGTIISY